MADIINPLVSQTVASPMDSMQDQELIKKLLTRKAPHLANPGTVTAGNLYYDSSTCAVVLAECVQNFGRYSQSLTTLQMGGVASITIPNSSFLSGLFLYMQLGALPANTFCPRGWALNAIDNISFILGSSNVSQVNINSSTHAQMYLAAAETAEKRNLLLRLAGDEIQGLQAPGTVNEAYVQLQLPWSRINAQMKKLPVDTNLLSSPIIVQIKFKEPKDFYTGSGFSSAPQSFLQGRVLACQIDLDDKELSLKVPMMRDPSLISSYPFTYCQSFPIQNVAGSPVIPSTMILQGIVNADLVGIGFAVIRADRVSGGPGGTQPLSPFAYEQVKDVLLQYNGLTLYDAPGKMSQLYDMQDMGGSSVTPYSVVSSGGAGPYSSIPVDSFIYFIPFTRVRNTQFPDFFQNSFRLANNALNLSFRCPETATYNVFVTYYYNAVFTIREGQSALVIT